MMEYYELDIEIIKSSIKTVKVKAESVDEAIEFVNNNKDKYLKADKNETISVFILPREVDSVRP